MYRSPNSTTENNEIFLENLTWAKNNFTEVIVVGDFNLPSISWDTNYSSAAYENMFLDTINDCGFHQMIRECTRYRASQTASLLDLILVSDPSSICNIEICDPIGKSDHCRIEFEVKNEFEIKEPFIYRYNFRKIDENKFKLKMSTTDWNFLDRLTIDESYNRFIAEITEIIDECVPKCRKHDSKIAPWSNSIIKRLSKKKRKHWDKYKFTRTSHDYNLYRQSLVNFENEKNIAITQYEERIIANKNTNPKAYYRYVSSKDKYNHNKIILKNGSSTENDQKKCAEILNNYFSSIFTVGASNIDVDMSKIQRYQNMNDINIEESDIQEIISNLDASKAAGPDGIPSILIKKFSDAFVPLLLKIFTRSYNEGIVPKQMKTANVIPLHKGGDKNKAENFRPVSLTDVIIKIFERVVKKYIEEHIQINQIISEYQHGFCKGKSTSSNLINFCNDLSNYANESSSISIVYTDLRKAFDSVPHDLLLLKLQRYGIAGRTGRWLKNFLSGRKQRVSVEGVFSGYKNVISGVPQGGCLSGTLFALYIDDLPSHMSYCRTSLYADDAKMYMQIKNDDSVRQMQDDLDAMMAWCANWRLTLNAGKCNHVQYNPRSASRSFNPTYMLGGTQVVRKQQVKDLGIIISEDLKSHAQVSKACQRAHQEINRIRRSFVSRSPAFLSNIYKLYVRPHMEYCVEVWNPKYKGDVDKLEKVQNKMTRLIRNGASRTPEQRNQLLGISSHEQRRLRGDLINIYKNINNQDIFQLRDNQRLRGHNKTIVLPRSNCAIKSHSFSVRAINEWNNLPETAVNSISLNSFKNNISAMF